MGHNSDFARSVVESTPGQVDRFETFEEFGQYLRDRVNSVLSGLAAGVAFPFFLRSQMNISQNMFAALLIGLPLFSILLWRLLYLRHSKHGYIEITDETITRKIGRKLESHRFSALRDIELPSNKELANGQDYLYLNFGDGSDLDFEQWVPNFPKIKHAIMRRVAVHPDLDFLRKRLSKEAAE